MRAFLLLEGLGGGPSRLHHTTCLPTVVVVASTTLVEGSQAQTPLLRVEEVVFVPVRKFQELIKGKLSALLSNESLERQAGNLPLCCGRHVHQDYRDIYDPHAGRTCIAVHD